MVLVSGILWRGTPLLGRDVRACGRGLGLVLAYCETGGGRLWVWERRGLCKDRLRGPG